MWSHPAWTLLPCCVCSWFHLYSMFTCNMYVAYVLVWLHQLHFVSAHASRKTCCSTCSHTHTFYEFIGIVRWFWSFPFVLWHLLMAAHNRSEVIRTTEKSTNTLIYWGATAEPAAPWFRTESSSLGTSPFGERRHLLTARRTRRMWWNQTHLARLLPATFVVMTLWC